MDYLPHTDDDVASMLATIGVDSVQDLFESVPSRLLLDRPLDVPVALSEPELVDHFAALGRASRSADDMVCFAGGGAYDHHVPAAVTALASRAEFATSYTPYQAELSQGVLQALYEFQTLICELYGMDVANASLYDGANAVVEAVNLAVRVTARHKVLVGASLHPHYLAVLKTYTSGLGLEISEAPFDPGTGVVAWDETTTAADSAAVVVADPNVFGQLEDVEAAARIAHEAGALCVTVTDPTALGILSPPGDLGADVAVGEGHALGNALAYGGPYVGLFATKQDLVRQVPGRISGATQDADGRRAFVLTLQGREQHIRRAKATSNVCTNQTLMALAATVYLAWLGPVGLARLGEICARRTAYAAGRFAEVPGCRIAFDGPRFKEVVVELPADARGVAAGLSRRGYLVGPALGAWFPELSKHLLVAVTERRTTEDIDGLAEAIEKELAG